MTWLQGTPLGIVEAHLEMMDRIKAEESMTSSTEVAMGKRQQPPDGQWERWRRVRDGGRQEPAAKPTATALGGMGIGVRKVGRKAVKRV